jgi:type II secretory ATPase GspE/PulE/Tfp pilus assembly ATPase PilB-like protein
LPEWDIILNAAGQSLGDKENPRSTLLLALNEDLSAGKRQLFILTTEQAISSNKYSSLMVKVMDAGYRVRGVLIATDPSILDVLISEWSTKTTNKGEGKTVTTSEIHDQWDRIIVDAMRAGASDIHLAATMGRGEVAFRVLGEIEPQPYTFTEEQALELAASMYNTMVDVGSTASGFNQRVIQDAVVTRNYPEGSIRLRYSGLPVEPNGINVTLRLIPIGVTAKAKTPEKLGYSEDQCHQLERMFARSSGLILFLGTTGSGKSTSMANMLTRLVQDRPGKKLRTVEEPVEIRIPGASQTSVVRARKSDADEPSNEFIDVMRALMRSDPDYLMVGEIRDRDTATLAIQAVRSGHLCVSTLHADGAPLAYDRLSGMGVDRKDLASVGLISGLVFQRLVPVLCEQCRVPAARVEQPDGQLLAVMRRLRTYLGDRSAEGIYFRSHRGCSACGGRGVTGRTVCAEILVPRPSMLHAISKSDSTELWKQWRSQIDETRPDRMEGRTAFEHALWKMERGICSPVDVEKEFFFLDEKVFG